MCLHPFVEVYKLMGMAHLPLEEDSANAMCPHILLILLALPFAIGSTHGTSSSDICQKQLCFPTRIQHTRQAV